MKPLYEIANEYQAIANRIADCDEITVEQLTALDQVSEDIKYKSINIGALVKNLEAESFAINEAINKMYERRHRLLVKVEHLKQYLKGNLERCDIKEIKSPMFDIKIKINPAAVVVNNVNEVPDKYFKEYVDRKLDKFLISQDLKNAIMIPGVLLDRRTRIEIK